MSTEENILLSKWLNGTATSEEISILTNQYDLDYLTELLNAQKSYKIDTIDDDKMWADFDKKREKKSKSKTPYLIAGLLFLLFASYLLFKFFDHGGTTIETNSGVSQHVALLDGSTIELSPGSSIKYDETNWSEKRKVSLKGQAVFQISKGTPFIVETEAGTIEVLGTQFDVWSIDNDYMSVKCFEGRVAVSNKQTQSIISGGEQIQVQKGKLSPISKFERSTSDWQQNLREFEKLPLNLVLADLSRFYNSEFKMGSQDEQDLFSGVIPIDDLSKTLRYLQQSTSYEYSTQGTTYIFNKK